MLKRRDYLVNDEDADLFGWLHDRTGLVRADDFRAVGRVIGSEIVGAFGYDNHVPFGSCQMHVCGDWETPGWLNRALLWKAFQVPFVEWGYKVVLGVIPSGNEPSINLATRLGFVLQSSIEGAHPDGALNIYVLPRDRGMRWLDLKYKEVRDGKEWRRCSIGP